MTSNVLHVIANLDAVKTLLLQHNNTTCLSKCHGGKSCSNQPAESEQHYEDDLMQEQSDEEEQHYCKPGSQGQENEDKSTTGFEMKGKFVSIQNEDQDHTNTSVHKDDNNDGKQNGQVKQKANRKADILM